MSVSVGPARRPALGSKDERPGPFEPVATPRQLLKGEHGHPGCVVLEQLFSAVLIAGISCVNAAIPAGAWGRSRDGRFLLLAGANVGLAALGGLWAWGELPVSPPSWTTPQLPIETLVAAVAVLLLATTLWPRHA